MGASQSKTDHVEDVLDALSDDMKNHILADTSPTKENLVKWFDTINDLIRDVHRR
jgi:hypothetical protein